MSPIISGGSSGGGGSMTRLYSSILGGAAASFDVTSIAQTASHLLIVLMGRGDTGSATTGVLLKFNNDGGANYDREDSNSTGATGSTAAGSSAQTSAFFISLPAGTATASAAGMAQMLVPFYTQTTLFKSAVSGGGFFPTLGTATSYGEQLSTHLWRSTAAINRVTLTPQAGNFAAGSGLTIYGIT